MAAEASEPEMSGIDADKNTRRDAPSQTNGQAARCTRVGYVLRPRPCEASTATTPTFSFISSSAAAHAPAEAAYSARPTPTLAEISLTGLPIRKSLQTRICGHAATLRDR